MSLIAAHTSSGRAVGEGNLFANGSLVIPRGQWHAAGSTRTQMFQASSRRYDPGAHRRFHAEGINLRGVLRFQQERNTDNILPPAAAEEGRDHERSLVKPKAWAGIWRFCAAALDRIGGRPSVRQITNLGDRA